MSDDLVKRWDDHVESLCSPMSTIEHMAQKMRNRIEALTAERDRLRKALGKLECKCSSNCDWLHDDICPSWIARAALKGATP